MRVDSRTVAVAAAGLLVTIALGALAGRTAGVAAGVIVALVGLVGSAVVTVVLERQSRVAADAARTQELLEMFAPPRPSEWAAPNFPDSGIGAISCCTLPVQVLIVDFLRSPVPEARMETSPIIPELDVACNVFPCFPDRRVHGSVNSLDFHHGIEGFCESIVQRRQMLLIPTLGSELSG